LGLFSCLGWFQIDLSDPGPDGVKIGVKLLRAVRKGRFTPCHVI
jgi:hypothetical protein